MNRNQFLLDLIPDDCETGLDIGSDDNIFKDKIRIITLDVENADIIQDLNLNQYIRLKSKSVDIVILSQILEHLVNVEKIIQEAKRITRKYILIGLPNEVTFDNRIRYFFLGKGPYHNGYMPYGHKHFFTIDTQEEFIRKFFGEEYELYRYFGVSGGRYIPDFMKRMLINMFPTLFSKESYYLIKEKNETQVESK